MTIKKYRWHEGLLEISPICRKFLKKFMNNREIPLDTKGNFLYTMGARVRKEWAQYAMKREIALKKR